MTRENEQREPVAAKCPVVEDLPSEEQEPFREFLRGKTVPINDDGTTGYYVWDYHRWKPGWLRTNAETHNSATHRNTDQ